MLRFAERIDKLGSAVGRAVSLLIFLMIAVISYEVIARYFFNAPTRWAADLSGSLQVAYVFFGGAYALRQGYLVRVDVLYERLPVRGRALIDLTVATALYICFAGTLLWKGGDLFLQSYNMGEVAASGGLRRPVYPVKLLIPLGVVLLSLAWIAHICRAFVALSAKDGGHHDSD